MRHLVRREPRQFEAPRSRWPLAALQRVGTWLQGLPLPGVSQILTRLRITYKRARAYVHSPDPHSVAKRLTVRGHRRDACRQATPRVVVLFQDEMTDERHPGVAKASALRGHAPPWPGAAMPAPPRGGSPALDACTGRVIVRHASTIRIPTLIRFYEQIAAAYADQPTLISFVQDHWPVHSHPDVLARLIPQTWAFPPSLPQNWPTTPRHTWPEEERLPIRLVSLPTYASWTNPIENLWRWLRQDVLPLHGLADDWAGLQAEVTRVLAQFATGSREWLRYVGLADLEAVDRSVFHRGMSPP